MFFLKIMLRSLRRIARTTTRRFVDPPKRIQRINESLDTKKARLIYQSRKRGILESDLLCSTFLEKYKDTLSEAQLDQFDKLLDESDWDLYYWCVGEKVVPDEFRDDDVLKMMSEHFRSGAASRMPNLPTKC